ncbi:MAG TPA: sialidase family protein [Candidatus Brocadiia bacterium]|nr:sialidase family protein [Candidatus Brocadiia bacterium]
MPTRKQILNLFCCAFFTAAWIASVAAQDDASQWKVRPLAQDYVLVCRSPDPANVYCYTPGLARCPNGRLIATMELGGKVKEKKPKPVKGSGSAMVMVSDDHGKTWQYRTNFKIGHARPFIAGDSVYILGQSGDLRVMRSDDWGDTWTEPVTLTDGQKWHQSACNVHYAKGNVYLVMEKRLSRNVTAWGGWGVSEFAPVLLRGKIGDDLTKRESWTFASDLVFNEAVKDKELDWFGVPFYPAFYPEGWNAAWLRSCAPIGWLESNVVQIVDPDNYWYDPKGCTFHIWMRAHTGGTNFAAMCKAVEKDDGTIETMLETVPSGKRIVFVPCPGGQMRFHILYDETTKLYWLLSSQSTDSMTRADKLQADRYNLPNNERHRLQLHFSRNCIDWCFAGLVAVGDSPKQSRHYASMIIDGNDLHILSRSGDAQAKSAHDGDMITFHTVRDFRRLVY